MDTNVGVNIQSGNSQLGKLGPISSGNRKPIGNRQKGWAYFILFFQEFQQKVRQNLCPGVLPKWDQKTLKIARKNKNFAWTKNGDVPLNSPHFWPRKDRFSPHFFKNIIANGQGENAHLFSGLLLARPAHALRWSKSYEK